jgi:lysine-N-methylase
LIAITDEERRRIESQGWQPADGVPAGRPPVVRHGGGWRLNHQPDGACVFLDANGLCRIHAKFGEAAKPLACRIYPYALHPAGKELAVSLRFSCPSVVGNLGQAVSAQTAELNRIAKAIVPKGAERIAPPPVHGSQSVDWPDVLRITDALDTTFAKEGAAFPVRLLRALFWMNLVGRMKFDAVRGERLGELLELLRGEAALQVESLPTAERPSRIGRMLFRMAAAQYARRDTARDLEAGLGGRWRLLTSALRFARGGGSVPVLREEFRPVPFAALEGEFGGLDAAADEILTRYMRVKLQGLHFCGAAFYGLPLVEGFQSLALVYPVVMWLARWRAVGAGRHSVTTDDIAHALTVADHNHGYSEAFATRASRSRLRMLVRNGDLARLVTWYSR